MPVKEKELIEAPPERAKTEKKTYVAMPGFSFAGMPNFPLTTDDPELQARIEGSFAFQRAKRVWVDSRTTKESEALESALSGLNFNSLRKMASALGHRDVAKYSKAQLVDILEREGF